MMALVVFYANYLVHSGPGHHYFHALLIVLLFVFGAVRTFIRYRSWNVVEDERDRSIAAIGTRWSNLILWLGLVIVLVLYWGQRVGAVSEFADRDPVSSAGARRVRPHRSRAGGVPEVGMKSPIRNTIRELRAARSMTQQELADLILVTRQTVVAIEGDKYSPSLEVAFRIAAVFGVPLEQVFQYHPAK
jgi:putative transcriptional regulator